MTGIESIRARLTAWYTLVLAVALLASGLISYKVTERQVRRAADASLTLSVRQVTAALSDEAEESGRILESRSAVEVLAAMSDNERPMIVLTNDGREFAASSAALTRSLDRAMLRRRVAQHAFGLATVAAAPGMRLLLEPIEVRGTPFVLAVAQSLAPQQQLLGDLRNSMLVSIPLALLIAAAGGYLLARKSLSPVAAMSAKARAISAASLGERIEIGNPRDELGQLAVTLNALLQRMEESFDSQRRFMADASHELRTPVAILQGEIDVALSRENRDAREYRESLEIMRKSVRRLTRIVRDLFLLARGDAGQYPLRSERFYLEEVVVQTVQQFRTVAAERGVSLREDHRIDLVFRGDEDLIQRLLGNLVDNAIRHTPAGGRVSVSCTSESDHFRIEVADTGSGIAPELRESIFERFFRGDSTHTAAETFNGSGAGLGLPIARWIAEAHGGRLDLARTGPSGSVFVVLLPRTETVESVPITSRDLSASSQLSASGR